jgi:hypothetical protein
MTNFQLSRLARTANAAKRPSACDAVGAGSTPVSFGPGFRRVKRKHAGLYHASLETYTRINAIAPGSRRHFGLGPEILGRHQREPMGEPRAFAARCLKRLHPRMADTAMDADDPAKLYAFTNGVRRSRHFLHILGHVRF